MNRFVLTGLACVAALALCTSCDKDQPSQPDTSNPAYDYLHGTVVLYDAYGKVVDSPSGVTVTAVSEPNRYTTVTDAQGQWKIPGAKAGVYHIEASMAGYDARYVLTSDAMENVQYVGAGVLGVQGMKLAKPIATDAAMDLTFERGVVLRPYPEEEDTIGPDTTHRRYDTLPTFRVSFMNNMPPSTSYTMYFARNGSDECAAGIVAESGAVTSVGRRTTFDMLRAYNDLMRKIPDARGQQFHIVLAIRESVWTENIGQGATRDTCIPVLHIPITF